MATQLKKTFYFNDKNVLLNKIKVKSSDSRSFTTNELATKSSEGAELDFCIKLQDTFGQDLASISIISLYFSCSTKGLKYNKSVFAKQGTFRVGIMNGTTPNSSGSGYATPIVTKDEWVAYKNQSSTSFNYTLTSSANQLNQFIFANQNCIGVALGFLNPNTTGKDQYELTQFEAIVTYIPTYKIYYNLNGGNQSSLNGKVDTRQHGNSYQISSLVPTKVGYTFVGWQSSYTNNIYLSSDALEDTENSTITLTAQWKKNSYIITLNKAGGSSGDSTVVVLYDTEIPSIIPPTKTGYSFMGYYDSSGKQYYSSTGTSNQIWNQAAGAEFIARWQALTFSIQLNSSIGTFSGSKIISIIYDDKLSSLSTDQIPACVGYKFLGYYDGSVQIYNSQGVPTFTKNWTKAINNYPLTAKWTKNSIYLGAREKSFKQIYIGKQSVKEVYVGKNKVWGKIT